MYQGSRNRGVVLTDSGVQRLYEASRRRSPGSGIRIISREELADMANLSVKTVRRVFDQNEGVDRRTLQDLFSALGLALQPGDFIGVRSLDRTRTSRRPPLPVPGTSFLGRDAEVEQAKSLLESARLLTLTGPGGIGKTRLAIKVAGDLTSRFRENVWFIDLSSQSRNGLIDEAILTAMGLSGTPDIPPRRLIVDFLARQPALLVLDNCEHVVCQTADLADELLASAPHARVIVTTRENLGLSGEIELQVRAFPVPSHDMSLDALQQYDVVRLFVDRAAIANSSFRLTVRNARDIADICRRVEGIPFAVELAAARIKTLTPQDLIQRLGDRFGVLGSVHRLTSRHRTLRESLEWSYGLLSPAEQIVFNKLSLFMGGWTLEAAIAVASDEAHDEDLVDLLGQLVNKSLVLVDFQGTSQRYRYLETTREFAFDMLVKRGELPRCETRYAAYYFELAKSARGTYDAVTTSEWITRLTAERDNIRNVLEMSLLRESDVELGCRLADMLTPYWLESGQWREGARWLTLARDRCRLSDRLPALSYGLGLLEAYGHAGTQALANIEISARGWTLAADQREAGVALHTLGMLQLATGHNSGAAVENFERAVDIHRAVGHRRAVGAGLLNLALQFTRSEREEQRRKGLSLFAESLDYLHEPDESARLFGSDREGRGALGTISWDVENDLVVDKQLFSVLAMYPAFGIGLGLRVATLELSSGMPRSARARCLDAIERALGTGSIEIICDVLDDVASLLAEAGMSSVLDRARDAAAALRRGTSARAAVSGVVQLVHQANLAR